MVYMDIIQKRLHVLEINEMTYQNMRLFEPIFDKNINNIVFNFYRHMSMWPETAEMFKNRDMHKLKENQKEHWRKLFHCELDDKYVVSATRIGLIHYRNKIPPYFYTAGYSFFHGEMIRIAGNEYRGDEIVAILSSIAKLISLDMELALSAYTKSEWVAHATPASPA